MIRTAKFADIPGIAMLLQEAYSRSHYAREGTCDIDIREAKRLLIQSIQRHNGKHGGATWVQVAERNGAIEGLVIGTLARVNVIGTKLMATDLMFVCSERVFPADPFKLMKGMVDWAWSSPDVIEVMSGSTAVILDDPSKASVIYERLGMKLYGHIYRAGREGMKP